MKKIILLTLGLLACLFCQAQTVTVNHPTIDSVKVTYLSDPQSTISLSEGFQVIPQATVSLNPSNTVSKIYFKLLDPETGAVIYNINYSLSASPVVNPNGLILFQNNSGIIFISSGSIILLKPYLYEIKTENALLEQSTVYSTIQ